MHKFKHLAIQCGAAQSPKRSPVVRRKTTLGMLLRRRGRRRECLLEKREGEDEVRRHSLKDLFQSSPPGADISGSPKHASTGFRYRSLLSKKAWRLILLSVTE
uniref:Uncharacterized protein n=1 Tax=Cajanus cajan TaxID=3821 RepID=A0A151TFG4_CAJCA|nr:hypothetical protein KK1_011999 [Cajanus cajan]